MKLFTTISTPVPKFAQTTVGSAKKLACFAEDKFGVGALSFPESKSNEKKKKKKKHCHTPITLVN